MIMPFGPLRTRLSRLIHISPSCWTNYMVYIGTNYIGKCPLYWNSNPIFYEIHCFKKTFNLIELFFKIVNCRGSSGCNGWADEPEYISAHCRLTHVSTSQGRP